MSNTPKTQQARQAKAAAKAEANGQSVTVDYGGKTYEVAPSDDWPIEVLEAAEDGKAMRMLRGVLGYRQWETFKSTSPVVRDVNELADKIAEASGLGKSGSSD